MKKKTDPKPPKPDLPRLAVRWGTSRRTLHNWRADGAPLTAGDDAMIQWLSAQRSLPEGTQRILDAHRRVAAAAPAGNTLITSEPGAPHALARLHQAELRCAQSYTAALQDGDPVAVRRTERSWTNMLMALGRYENLVQENERLTHALVSRADVEKHLQWIGACLVYSAAEIANVAAHTLARTDDVTAVAEGLKQLLETKQHTSLAAWAVKGGTPDWMVRAITNFTRDNVAQDFDAWFGQLKQQIAQAVGRHAEQRVQGTLRAKTEIRRQARVSNPCNCASCCRWRVGHGGIGNDPSCPHLADREAGRSYPGSP